MIEAELPDGTVLEFPEGTSPDVIQRVVKQRLGVQDAPKGPNAPNVIDRDTYLQQVQARKDAGPGFFEKGGTAQNIGGGFFRGPGSIGSTLLSLTPFDKVPEAIDISRNAIAKFQGKPPPVELRDRDAERRADMDAGLRSLGANPDSLVFKGTKLGTEVLGTLGVGGALAKGVAMLPGVAAKAAPWVQALRTGGFNAGGVTGAKGLAVRAAGGAGAGGGAAALADPEQIGTGATIGAAIPVAGKAIAGTGTLIKKAIGATTGVGDAALTQALRAGKEGGKVAQNFTQAMRGESSMDDVLTMAKQNLEAMGQQKQAAYRQGMAGIKADKTVLDLKNVDQAVNDAIGMATFKGQIKNEKAASALSQIKGEIDNWKSLDPAEFHTPEGLDALKQKIGGILEEIPFEQKTARTAAGKVYDSLRGEISKQAPEYAKVMKGYSEASDTIKEIEKALSLGQKASADTSMRKLQSLMRNNVNANYGQRADLAQEMIQAGGQDFMPSLAGQALNDFMPRGIQRAGVGTGGAGLALTGNLPAAAGLAAISSPRLMGETFYTAGKVAGKVDPELIKALRKATYMTSPIAGIQESQSQ
jgi:hypothetical protein